SSSIGLAQQATGGAMPSGLVPLPPQLLDQPGIVAPGPGAATASSPVVSGRRPWLAWRPVGVGQLTEAPLPSPWTVGAASTGQLTIYTPPGYSAASAHAYPTVYEVPWGLGGWQTSAQLPAILDSLIDGGEIPPTIVVFTPEHGGPFPDSECANSADHREW